MKTCLAAAACLAALSLPAVAQEDLGSVIKGATRAAIGGMATGDRPPAKLSVERRPVGSLLTSKLVGATVYNDRKETVGKVEDLVIVEGKAISGVVVSVGGFLGMGESYVLVNPGSLAVDEKDGTVSAYVNATKDQLKAAPKFAYGK